MISQQPTTTITKTNKSSQYAPLKSIEGWIIIVTNLHEQSQQDDVYDAFSKYGQVKNIHLNMDRKTGYAKGYALIEYEKYEQADSAIKDMNNQEIYERIVRVDWAFREQPNKNN